MFTCFVLAACLWLWDFLFVSNVYWLGWAFWRWKPYFREEERKTINRVQPCWHIRWGSWHVWVWARWSR